MDKLLKDKDPVRRVLGMMIGASLPLDRQKEVLTQALSQEKEEMVKLYGSAALEMVEIMSKAPQPVPVPPAGAETPAGGAVPAGKP